MTTKPLDEVMPHDQIRIKTMCILIQDGKILASKGYDSVAQKHFYRLIGGTLEFGEIAERGIRREVFEELNSEINNLKFVDIIENIFTYQGKAGHQIVFLFKGDLNRSDLFDQKVVKLNELTYDAEAEWISCNDVLTGKVILYPEYDYSKIL